MKIPQLKKKPETKTCHNVSWVDNYSFVDQKKPSIMEVLKDSSKLNPEVKKYIDEENAYTKYNLKDTEELQSKLFNEIKGKLKLDDETIPFKDRNYFYWTKISKESQYSTKLRKKIDSSETEEYWNGQKEFEKHKSKFFSVGDLSVSWNDLYLGYSLDLKGSEYFTIYIRRISDQKMIEEKIEDTTGNISWGLDDTCFYYSKLNDKHRCKTVYRHRLGTSQKEDELIFEEKSEIYTVSFGLTSDEKWHVINSSDHNSDEIYYFDANNKNSKPKLFKKREEEIKYGIDSWKEFFYVHTNKDAEDFKICRVKHTNLNEWEDFIPAKKGVLIGGLTFLNDYIIRAEKSNALPKIFIRNFKNGEEEDITHIISDEEVISPGASLMQKDTNTTKIHIGYDSLRTQARTYEYDIVTKKKKLIKEEIVPSGHNPSNYTVRRLYANSHDGKKIPISLVHHKKTKLDGSAKLLLYGYSCYGVSIPPSFSSSRFCLVDRDIIFAISHARGSMDLGMHWWNEGKLMQKMNTMKDFISCANYLIEKKYTSKGKIIFLGGSAGGLLGGAVANMAPELFLSMVLNVPYVNVLDTALNEDLPLSANEFKEIGRPKKNKEHFNYIKSYSPYENISNKDYPSMFITTSLFDSRVFYSEPVKYTAKLRDMKTDKNLLLLKCETAGHGGKTGRDNSISELAEEFAFILKSADIKK